MSKFSYERRVAFADTDAARVAHFTSMFRYVEEAEHAFLRAHEVPVFEEDGPGWPRVACSLSVSGPAFFDQLLNIVLVRVAPGTSSVEWVWRIDDAEEEFPVAEITMKTVCVRMSGVGMRPEPLPEEFRQVLAAYGAAGG